MYKTLYKKMHKTLYKLKKTDLFPIESLGGVEGLYERGRVSHEERVADGAREHADHGQPDVTEGLGRVATVPYAQHVGESLEQRPSVLLRPVDVLQPDDQNLVNISGGFFREKSNFSFSQDLTFKLTAWV